MRVGSVKVHTFLLFYSSVSSTKRAGAAPRLRSCFSGGTSMVGSQNRNGAGGKQKLRRRPAPQCPKQCRDKG